MNRRNVQLLKCANDRALVIPYLNKIIQELKEDHWVRNNDVLAQQPFRGKYDEGAVRRAANIMLALKYPKEGNAFVNKIAYKLIESYARKGELYSVNLREHLLAVLCLSNPVCIRALKVSARQVLEDDVAVALVREMIHDCLEKKIDFDSERNTNENDAYYDAAYVRSGCPVSNNVCWSTGVPLFGIACNAVQNAALNGKQVIGGRAFLGRTWRTSERRVAVKFWVPVDMQYVALVVIPSDDVFFGLSNQSMFFDEVVVLRYSRSAVDGCWDADPMIYPLVTEYYNPAADRHFRQRSEPTEPNLSHVRVLES